MSNFVNRLVSRIDRVDAESLQAQIARFVSERGFLEAIFRTVLEGILVLDAEGRLLFANVASERILGFDFKKLRGRPFGRYLKDWEWEELAREATNRTSGKEREWASLATREVELTYPEHRIISFYASRLTGTKEHDFATLLILRDVTKDREQEASDLAAGRFEAVKLLAAGVAHEIGNPLNALGLSLQLLDREVRSIGDTKQREGLAELTSMARQEVSRLHAIITQFLTALRPRKPVLRPGNPIQILEETLRTLKPDIENRAIRVVLDLCDSLPLVPLDADQIKQVFFNLLKNAMEALPDKGTIRVSFSYDDRWVNILFVDDGCGIEAARLGEIFEPCRTSKKKGSGLGLMVVSRIVRDHGGEIQVSSKPGEGTQFTIRLPRAERRVRRLTN